MTEFTGLTSAEVANRIARGQVNRTPRSEWREYAQIFQRNLITWFNAMVTPAAVALFLLKEYQGALAVSGMAIVNTVLALAQEIRAKRHLDKLAILVEARARVLRDGQVRLVPSGDVVLGEHIRLEAGDSVVADGALLQAQFLEVDEALLTGESDPVRRHPGDRLLSGSFCVAGEGLYRADRVGPESFAQQTSNEARRYHQTLSPLTIIINRIVQALSYAVLGLILLYTVAFLLRGYDDERDFVRMVAATITSMVPQGLVLTATIAFTLGAIVMSRRGAIVQRLSAVETMAAIDVICTDKTGTLTTNRLHLEEIIDLGSGLPDGAVRAQIRCYAAATMDGGNRNIQALRLALGQVSVESIEQIPFKAQNRYSAVRFRNDGVEQVLAMGALEALRDRIILWDEAHPGAETLDKLTRLVEERQPRGLRLIVFGELASDVQLASATVLPQVPIRPLALICLGDELRPDAGKVLEALASQGIAFKVISGDNPETVRGTVSHIDLPLARDPVVSGVELAQSADKRTLILTRSVFGRVSPEQKVEIVETLRAAGHRVAMIGDGVNDVLPIKRADLGIAMGEGSQASKTVSSLVLENNNFALLPETLEEGRTIVRNLRRSAKLFLVKNVYSLILILTYASGWLGLPFPYVPQQVTLLNWLVIGVPAFVIALSRERSTSATRNRFLLEVGWFAIRTGLVFGLAGVAILLAARARDPEEAYQRTMLLSVLVLLGITALFRALRDGESGALRGDTRFRLLGALAVPAYLLAMYWPFSARFFEMIPLGPLDWALVLIVAGAAYLLTLASDRLRTGTGKAK